MFIPFLLVLFLSFSTDSTTGVCSSSGEGKLIGSLKTRLHKAAGTVHVVDKSTFFITNFIYDGRGPDAFFWIGSEPEPTENGMLVPYPEGSDKKLAAFDGSTVLLKLPEGKTVGDIKWLAVWCRKLKLNFGEVMIPKDLVPPHPRVLHELLRLGYGVRSGNITILDGKTFHIPNLHFNGRAHHTYFLVGKGTEPKEDDIKVPDESGSLEPLHAYSGQDITIQLPGELTACDIDYLGLYCTQGKVNFGHVLIPKDLDLPPALGQNGDSRRSALSGTLNLSAKSFNRNILISSSFVFGTLLRYKSA